MSEENEFESLSLSPVNFFALEWQCHEVKEGRTFWKDKRFRLPDTSDLTGEEIFGALSVGWSHEGLYFHGEVDKPVTEVYYPNYERGDSLELFIDTRDVKSAGFNHRFCHHFVILPEAVEGVQAAEVTRFRTEDTHPLADPSEIQVQVKRKQGYIMDVFIPRECLHGYDPQQFDRLGFSYRLNRYEGAPQHFTLTSSEYQIDQHPAQWARFHLTST